MEGVIRNYGRFFDSPLIRGFLAGGGKVFIATEHRPIEVIRILYDLGHRDFSEKFVQEAEAKDARGRFPEINLHYFGCLQRNKIGKAIRLFDCIESLEKESAVAKLKAEMEKIGGARLKGVLTQINTGGEPQKRGALPQHADALIRYCLDMRLPLRGLMAIPPKQENPEPHFRLLRKTADKHRLEHCFMGMSGDFESAIRLGSTAIRIGRAIFSGPDPIPRESGPVHGLRIEASTWA
jgi:uncharacterized pyridoxal phosphate-containing UPF0001 family protein